MRTRRLRLKKSSIIIQEKIASPIQPNSVSLLVKKFDSDVNSSEIKDADKTDNIDNGGIGIENPSNASVVNFFAPSMAPLINYPPIKKEEESIEGLSSPVREFENDITQLCSPGEKDAMMLFWNGLSTNEKEGFVHGLRFIKKKYNNEGEIDSSFDDSIDKIRKLSSVSQRNDILMNWKDLNQKQKEKKVGETVLNIIPEGVPVSNCKEPVIVDLQKICSMRSQVKEKKVKKKIEIDEMVSQQLEQVCNEIVYHFPRKFSHLEIANDGEFKFKYVDADEKEFDAQMNIDGKEEIRTTGYNCNGGLLITEVSYAEKVSGKKLNAANLISNVKKNVELPDGIVEMPLSDILKGCSPFKTTLYGYFIDKHVNFFNVNKFAHNMWKKIWSGRGGVWMIFDSALIIRRWTTGVSLVKDQNDKIPVWIGKPLDVDAHTAKMCQEHWGRPAFMRILIEMSAAKDWLKEVHVYSSDLTTGDIILSECKIEYAWNPSKCSHCKVYGHKDSTCVILLAKEVKESNNVNGNEKNKDGIKVDLMEVLIASTKKVEEDNEGFQSVIKRNKGNNSGGQVKEETGKTNQNSVQGQNGNYQGNGKNGTGINVGSQGQKGNYGIKSGNNNGGNQWNKGKAIQGYNGKNYSKMGAVSVEKSNQDSKQKEDMGKKVDIGQKYVPRSGPDIKISSNFDKKTHYDKDLGPVKIFSNNKFDVLKNLEEENQFVFSNRGVAEVNLDYLDTVDQMEVIRGILLNDTNMEAFSNDV
ncbi:unnamed protein product [Lactuca saligna]|uniref:DUF4283 domain-containing protein n=1 Tax=Lactuca saligna TaxID=75948 RepID=A0AA35ZYG8_LACSI|nr:unnamed protein product [Lactuca saligna]